MISGANEEQLELANARANVVMKLDNTSTYESWLIIDTYIESLEKENQELKKQLEENQNPLKGIFAQVNDDTLLRNCGAMQSEIDTYKNQQKEIINYINAYIELLKDKPDLVEEGQKDILEEILSKYKEIIGDNK